MIDTVCELFETDDRQVAASLLVLGYFWSPMAGACACYLLDRRVPDLSPENVFLHLRAGVAFTSPRCWVLPNDPAAGHPDVTVVDDVNALRAQLVNQLEEHAAPLFTTLRSVARYGTAGMRANYVDRLVSAILWLAEQLGDSDLARREALAFIDLMSPKGRAGIIEIEHEGQCHVFQKRGGCCLNYRLPGSEKCDTCSLIPMDERIEGLRRNHLERQTAQ